MAATASASAIWAMPAHRQEEQAVHPAGGPAHGLKSPAQPQRMLSLESIRTEQLALTTSPHWFGDYTRYQDPDWPLGRREEVIFRAALPSLALVGLSCKRKFNNLKVHNLLQWSLRGHNSSTMNLKHGKKLSCFPVPTCIDYFYIHSSLYLTCIVTGASLFLSLNSSRFIKILGLCDSKQRCKTWYYVWRAVHF